MPNTWRLDEYIPCLDLYLRRGTLSESDREVQDVAKLIGRTPASVAFRLGNFQFVDPNRTGPGFSGGERVCQQIWDALAPHPDIVTRLTATMRTLAS